MLTANIKELKLPVTCPCQSEEGIFVGSSPTILFPLHLMVLIS